MSLANREQTSVSAHTRRINWLDWMKVFAMFFIVADHAHVPGGKYIYVFHVPVFFIISGFLSHHEQDIKKFWKKLFGNLVLPMIIFQVLLLLWIWQHSYRHGEFQSNYLMLGPIMSALGIQYGTHPAGGLGAMWFVYTLCLCKILFQYIPKNNKKIGALLVSILFIGLAIGRRHLGFTICNSWVNVLLAFPFFVLGFCFKDIKSYLSVIKLNNIILLLIASIISIWCCGFFSTSWVALNACSYGDSVALCLFGGVSGASMVYALARLVSYFSPNSRIAIILGGGTMIVLGLHPFLLTFCEHFWKFTGYSPNYLLYIEAIVVYILFIPINRFVLKYLPVLNGRYR